MRIIQLETAVGAAMKNFDGAHGKFKILILLATVSCKNLLVHQGDNWSPSSFAAVIWVVTQRGVLRDKECHAMRSVA